MNRTSKMILALCVILSFIAAFALVIVPRFIGEAVDVMIGVNNVDFTVVIQILMKALLAYLIYFGVSWLSNYILNEISLRFVFKLRNQLEYHLMRNPFSYLDSVAHGKLLNLFTLDGELLIDGIYQGLTQLLNGIFVVIIALYFMLEVSLLMSLLVILTVPVMILTSRAISKRSQQLFRTQQRLAASMNAHVKESLENHELIVNYNYAEVSMDKFEAIHKEYNQVGEKVQILGALVNPTVRVINNISYALLGLLGAYSALHYGLSVGSLMAFISYSILFSKPFNEFSAIISQLVAGKTSYERMQAALKVPFESDGINDVSLKGEHVQFEHVNFAYNKDYPIIKNLNLDIAPLSKVAIVGPTGAGKSTLINILMRFYDVDSGAIKIDGYDSAHLSKHSLRSVLSIVLQEPWLSSGSIRDNIKYGRVDASDEEMIAAAKQAGCYDYIMQLDQDFDTMVTSTSSTMSVGQRQMITIARAILVDAPIIILDEATSNIDILSEAKIQKAFEDVMAHKTSFFVAHHLSTVVDADMILVMKDGELIEQGHHTELMQARGFYYEMVHSNQLIDED